MSRGLPARVVTDGVSIPHDASLDHAAAHGDDRLRLDRSVMPATHSIKEDARPGELIRRGRAMLDGAGIVGVQEFGTRVELPERALEAAFLLLPRSVRQLRRMEMGARALRRVHGDGVTNRFYFAPLHTRAIHSRVDHQVPRLARARPPLDAGLVAEHGAKLG